MSSHRYPIEVDLDVFKALTAKIEAAGQDHNDVLRELLNLDSVTEADLPDNVFGRIAETISRSYSAVPGQFYSRGLALPSGTELRARYKGQQFSARIEDGRWLDSDGQEHSSPSAAAKAITDTSVNGWRFWEAKRPGDRGWRRLDILQSL
jgi:hypothetical protein